MLPSFPLSSSRIAVASSFRSCARFAFCSSSDRTAADCGSFGEEKKCRSVGQSKGTDAMDRTLKPTSGG